MISRIEEIYKEAYSKSPIADMRDRQLSEEVKRFSGNIPDYEKLTTEEIKDLVYCGGSIGQARGFQDGFRYAMALIFESLIG